MPYIVTTTEHNKRHREPGTPGVPTQWFTDVSRRAVATLDEAREAVLATLDATDPEHACSLDVRTALLPESGGTVGPLPDGTLVEVEQVDIREIAYRADFRWQTRRASDVASEILAAFNARAAL